MRRWPHICEIKKKPISKYKKSLKGMPRFICMVETH
jgi:hypothetical protein